MAYVNVAEWKPDQVCEWLKGLDSTVLPYIHSFLNHGVFGQQLLNLQLSDLESLGVVKLGHQEIILEAVEYLRKFHYELDQENLQLLALRLSTQAHSLYKELCRQNDSEPVTTQTLSDVASIMMVVKPLVRWMDYPPFNGHIEYHGKKVELMKISVEMATCAQRDRFAEKPVEEIRTACCKLAKLADYIIQDIADPIILQPASLDLATLKKKSSDDLGFYILPSFHGVHQITEIKLGSAAYQSGKMQEGDEIVQVNYQTVIGWERKNLLELFRESPAEILLTMKRRPKHAKIYGQIYIQPYKLPSNKNTSYTAQGRSLPSPRPELLTIPDFAMPSPRHIPKKTSPEPASIFDAVKMLDTMTTEGSDSDSETELYLKPRNLVQRRATITGASPTTKHGINIEQFWKELKREHNATVQLRDKAASCAHGLDNVPMVNIRPQTCLGLESAKKKNKQSTEQTNKKVQFKEKLIDVKSTRPDDIKEKVTPTQNCDDDGAHISKDINIEHLQAFTDTVTDSNNLNDTRVPLDESNNSVSDTCSINESMLNNEEIISMRYVEKCSKLDTNCSTSAYDLSDIEKLDSTDPCLLKISNNNKTKPDVYKVIENDGRKKLKDPSNEKKKAKRSGGNVARKIINIEKRIAHKNAEKQACAFGVPKRIDLHKDNINVTINGVNLENSTEEKNQNDLEHDVSDINDDKYAVKRTSIECENVANKYSKTIDLKNSACEYRENADCGTSEMSNTKTECSNSNSNHSSSNNSSSSNSTSTSSSSSLNSSSSSSNDGGDNDDDDGGGRDGSNSSNSNNSSSSNSGSSSSISHSNSIERDKTQKFDKNLQQTADCTFTQHADVLEKKFSSVLSRETCAEKVSPNNNTKFEDDLSNITRNVLKMQIDIKQQTKEAKSADLSSVQATIQSCRYIELPKVESVGKLENKAHATPPEPPPRKYYANQASTDLKLNNVPKILEDSQKPQVPERLGVKRELKKVESSSCVVHNIKNNSDDCRDKKGMRMLNYTENSMDQIGESPTSSLSDQKFDRLNLTDASLYNENNDEHAREEKCCFETSVEKFVCSDQSITDCYRFDHSPRNVDCPDGITHSKQTIPSDLKPRLSEKDKNIEKSVVNRAMMVAKSIGLHNSLNKSNSSPRSNRKRNMLLAKRRNVSVRDVGAGDLEGWLTYRSRGAGGAWAKAWFVLKCSSLYRFKTQDGIKADCLILLTGFTVAPASEVKSRKYSFKVYHTGTVFYFAADTEDTLILWLDAVSKGTLGAADTQNQSVGLFSETDESDNEGHNKSKPKCVSESSNVSPEKSFGSLKKSVRRDAGSYKDHEITGASLDRKYLKFLSARNQNIPVPTAQFRSYRRVLPTSTPSNKKEVCNSNSPDLQMTIAGSTFYGSTTSQSATDMLNNSYIISDYRHAADRSVGTRPLDNHLQGQEEFLISQQDEEQRTSMTNESMSPRATPLLSDHVRVQHRTLNHNAAYTEQRRQLSDISLNDIGNIYGKTNDETPNNNITYVQSKNTNAHVQTPRQSIKDTFIITRSESEASCASDKSCGKCMAIGQKRMWDSSSYAQKRRPQELVNSQKTRHDDSFHWRNAISPSKQNSPNQSADYELDRCVQSPTRKSYKMREHLSRNIGYSGSSNDLASHTSSETQQCIKKDVSISRKGSFNLTNRHDYTSSDKHWLDSLRRGDKKRSSCDKNRLKNVAQYQPPPIPTSPFEQDGMRATFEMHLDKSDHVQKASRLKVLFGTKQQKPCTLDLPKNTQKTVVGSPRLHRALFRDKCCSTQSHHHASTRSGSQSPSGISQTHSSFNENSPCQFTQTSSPRSLVSDWNPDASTSSNISKYDNGYSSNHNKGSGRMNMAPPMLPYIPPPTSPPPDYPGLEYPPVFEPGTYSLSDASLLRTRNKSTQNTGQ
ncbi:connector enhancer of ksr isoform X2 [Temnothorax americanus]|uniref:connector enhancer of ksr isoform X2 n=1 Tax=Temnothorax americanus TaxID=1964332 RepID=UPI004067B9F1